MVKRYPVTCHDVSAQLYAKRKYRALAGLERAPTGVRPKNVVELPLVVREPQWVRFADRYYRLDREGLYRFWDWGLVRHENATDRPKIVDGTKCYSCVILYRRDVLGLLAALATLHVHGYRHSELSFEQRVDRRKQGTLSLICGDVSLFLAELMRRLGWRARLVMGMRLGTFNTYDNGHTLVEFYWPRHRKWVAADIDLHHLFARDGAYLNLWELCDLVRKGKEFDLVPMTGQWPATSDTTEAVAGGYAVTTQLEPFFADPAWRRAWYRRCFTIPFVEDEGLLWFCCGRRSDEARLLRYSSEYRAMPAHQWYERFYG